MRVHVVIPTVEGRAEHLERCLRGYVERTSIAISIEIIYAAPTCGIAWQVGSEGLGDADFLHFTADDIVPGEGWDLPCIEAVERGNVPVIGVINCTPEVLDDEQFPISGNPRRESHYSYFEDHSIKGEGVDWYAAPASDSYYPSVPFCSAEQWERIGPMVASHYGTDKWFGHRAKLTGYWPVIRRDSVMYHYTAQAGRIPGDDWYHLDRLNFDLNIAYPKYVSGALKPDQTHRASGTAEGLRLARDWYLDNCSDVRYWEQPR